MTVINGSNWNRIVGASLVILVANSLLALDWRHTWYFEKVCTQCMRAMQLKGNSWEDARCITMLISAHRDGTTEPSSTLITQGAVRDSWTSRTSDGIGPTNPSQE